MDGCLASAAILVSFGAIIGKVSPLQLLAIALIEVPVYVANSYVVYDVLGVVDPGATIALHTFGAYFGLAVSFAARSRDYDHPGCAGLQDSRYGFYY